jgi:prepilin peptidase CpaA
MPLNELIEIVVPTALIVVLVWAAISDVSSLTIPNAAVLAVVGLFALRTLAHGGQDVWSGLAAAGVTFIAMTVLYARGVVGGADSKLLSAVALFAGLHHLLGLLVITTMAGGVIALYVLAQHPRRTWAMLITRCADDHGPHVPYGVPIALGGMLMIWSEVDSSPVAALLRERIFAS